MNGARAHDHGTEIGARTLYGPPATPGTGGRPVTLVELLDRLLGAGVVVQGHITLAAADIDLVDLDLALLLSSSDTARSSGAARGRARSR